jgi:hypothetical protein
MVGSIEGRCGTVNIDLSNPEFIQGDDFSFKCHREGQDMCFTINAISFNKKYDTFCTGGSDGKWMTWSNEKK